jgi:hypothetical protein
MSEKTEKEIAEEASNKLKEMMNDFAIYKPHVYFMDGIKANKSDIGGRGVFSQYDVMPGHIFEISPAIYLPHHREIEPEDRPIINTYLFEVTSEQEACHTWDQLESRTGVLIGLGYTSLYNHSETPNATYYTNKNSIGIVSIKKIAVGEEIFIDYGWSFSAKVKYGLIKD